MSTYIANISIHVLTGSHSLEFISSIIPRLPDDFDMESIGYSMISKFILVIILVLHMYYIHALVHPYALFISLVLH